MAELSWPSPDNGRVVDEIQYEQMAAHFSEDGFYMDPAGAFIDPGGLPPVFANGSLPMGVKFRAGRYASVRGFGWTSGDTDVLAAVTSNSSGAVRIDRAVLELDRSTWNVRAKVVPGTPGSGIPPALQRDQGPTGVFQVPVARVTVPNGATAIAAGNVYVDGHYVGSRLRPWKQMSDMAYPVLGEVGFDESTRSWFGWNGAQRVTLAADTGWVSLSMNGGNGNAWTPNNVCRVRKRNGLVSIRMFVERWSSSALSVSDSDGSVPTILSEKFRPSVDEILTGHGFASRSLAAIHIETDGSVRIFSIDSPIPANGTVGFSGQWLAD